MRNRDVISISIRNIFRLKLKSALTVLSIGIGVAAVYTILSLCSMGEVYIDGEIDRLGIDGLTLYNKGSIDRKIDLSVGEFLENEYDFIDSTMPLVATYSSFKIKGESRNALLLGVDHNLPQIMGINLLHGRSFSNNDITHSQQVAIIDKKLAQSVYKRDNIVGKKIRLTLGNFQRDFEIIGVIESQKNMLDGISGGKIPELIYVPYTSLGTNQLDKVDQIAIKCSENTDVAVAASIINDKMNSRIGDEYAVENINGYISQVKGLISTVSILLSSIAAISLIVAGIGVMNRMLSSVVERKNEIGIWIALGAKKKDIFKIMLCESIFLCIIGGLVGGAVGLTFVGIIQVASIGKFSIDFAVFAFPIGFSMLIGIIFGIIPSKQASNLSPVELLKNSD